LLLGEAEQRINKGCKMRFKVALNPGFELVDIKADKIFSIPQEGGRKNV